MSAYQVMSAEKATPTGPDGFQVTRMAELLGLSRSGFCDWQNRQAAGPTPAQQRRAELAVKIGHVHHESDRVYGAPRILADLREPANGCHARRWRNSCVHRGLSGSAHAEPENMTAISVT